MLGVPACNPSPVSTALLSVVVPALAKVCINLVKYSILCNLESFLISIPASCLTLSKVGSVFLILACKLVNAPITTLVSSTIPLCNTSLVNLSP